MRRGVMFSVVAGLAVACCGSTLRAGPAVVPRGEDRYAGVKIVRVEPVTARQRLAVAQIGLRPAGEGAAAVGGWDCFADAAQAAMLEELGVPTRVLVSDVPGLISEERARLDARAQAPAGDAFFDEFRDLAELTERWEALRAAAGGLVTRRVIGQSVEGREILAYEIASPAAAGARAPALFFNGAAHAREWISPMTVLFVAESLALNYGVDAGVTGLLDRVRVYAVPVANPDGFAFAWSPSGDRFWRKNRRNNGDGTFGVDWNRNFSVGYGVGSSTDPASDVYRGAQPFSEPETRAIRDYVQSRPEVVAHIDFHSYSQLILWPFGFDGPSVDPVDELNLVDLSLDMRGAILASGGVPYAAQRAIDLYPAGGTSQDWVFGATGAYSWTIELRPADGGFTGLDGFAPSPALIRPTAEENLAAVRALMAAIARGVRVTYPGGEPATLAAGAPTALSVEVRPVFSAPIDAAGVRLRYAVDGGEPESLPLGTFDGLVFTGTLPALPCGAGVSIEVIATDTQGVVYTDGAVDADVRTIEVTFEDAMEADTGWTVGSASDTASTGLWTREDPQPTDAQPGDDRSPAGTRCWITDGRAGTGVGSFDVDGGSTTLTSPALDATAGDGDAFVVYWRWYSNDRGSAPNEDSMPVEISGDGGQTWALLESVAENAGAWVERRFRVADHVTPGADVRVRFVARDEGAGSIVEAGVDDLRLEFAGCPAGSAADVAPAFGVLDVNDVITFVQGFNAADPVADVAPAFGSLDVNDVIEFVRAFNDGLPR